MKFIRDEAMRLGVDLQTATKEFTKFSIATKSMLNKDQQRSLFTGVSEYATVLGVDKEQYHRAFIAMQQIASKSQLYKEDVVGQLAEALGGSTDLMMKAAGYTSTEQFFKAMESGKLMAKDILPKFAEELKKASREGGALDAVMKKTRAQMGRFFNTLTEGKDAMFQAGFDEGLGYMFGSLADLIKELEPLAKAFGAVFRGAITTITAGVKIALTPFRGLVDLFESLGDNLERLGILDGTGGIWSMVGAGGVIALMATKFSWLAKAIWTVNAALLAMMARFAPIIAAYAVLEDLSLYATYGDKADTITGRAVKGLQAGAEQVNPRGIFENLWKGYSEYSPVGFLVNVSVNDSELSKVISANVEQTNQKKAAINQTETSQ